MRRHPPKVSRKKLKAEIESLKGQCLSWQMIVSLTAQVFAVQIATMQWAGISKRFCHGGIVPDGETVSQNNGDSLLNNQQVKDLEQTINAMRKDES